MLNHAFGSTVTAQPSIGLRKPLWKTFLTDVRDGQFDID